jgi:general secretion pathway protein G
MGACPKGEAGFTLMELMIVVVIISILAALVVPNLISSVDEAGVAAAKAQIQSFKAAIINYKLKFKKYPSSLNDLVSNPKRNFLDSDSVPLDPWDNKYQYTCPGKKGHDFEIVSFGSDGQPGGTDTAADIQSWNLHKSGGE